jgi:hypothetical protein
VVFGHQKVAVIVHNLHTNSFVTFGTLTTSTVIVSRQLIRHHSFFFASFRNFSISCHLPNDVVDPHFRPQLSRSFVFQKRRGSSHFGGCKSPFNCCQFVPFSLDPLSFVWTVVDRRRSQLKVALNRFSLFGSSVSLLSPCFSQRHFWLIAVCFTFYGFARYWPLLHCLLSPRPQLPRPLSITSFARHYFKCVDCIMSSISLNVEHIHDLALDCDRLLELSSSSRAFRNDASLVIQRNQIVRNVWSFRCSSARHTWSVQLDKLPRSPCTNTINH